MDEFAVMVEDVQDIGKYAESAINMMVSKGCSYDVVPASKKYARSVLPRFFINGGCIGTFGSFKRFMLGYEKPEVPTIQVDVESSPTVVKPEPYDVPAREVDFQEIAMALYRLNTGIQFDIADGMFWVASEEDFMTVVKETKLDRVRYRRERVDCDNFATRFAGLANEYGLNSVAIVRDRSDYPDKGHSYNIVFIDYPDGVVAKAFEPQNDKLVEFGHGHYKGVSGIAFLG